MVNEQNIRSGIARLLPKDWEHCDPVLVVIGAGSVLVGGYGLYILGLSGPVYAWLIRGIPAIFVALGSIILIRQFQLWRELSRQKKKDPQKAREWRAVVSWAFVVAAATLLYVFYVFMRLIR